MNRNSSVIFAYPSIIKGEHKYPGMIQISLTGSKCELQCNHCKGQLLASMPNGETPEKLWNIALKHKSSGGKGILITGGSDRHGRLPFRQFSKTIKKISSELDLFVAAHAGLSNYEDALLLAESGVKLAMTDIFGDTDSASESMNIPVNNNSFINTVRYLSDNGIAVAPHIIVGFNGKTGHEEDALKMLEGLSISSIIFLSYRKITKNSVNTKKIIPPERMADLISYAYSMHNVPIGLGCMKAHGSLRTETEIAALEAGVDVIALPSEKTVLHAKNMDFKIENSSLCCALSLL